MRWVYSGCSLAVYSDGKNNDEAIFKETHTALTAFAQPNDFIYWDCGYRYVVQLAQGLGFEVAMPNVMRKKQRQHINQESNESRTVTMSRWIIEVVNGRLKNKFKILNEPLQNWNILRLEIMLKVCCCLQNAFSPKIERKNCDYRHLIEEVLRQSTRGNKFCFVIYSRLEVDSFRSTGYRNFYSQILINFGQFVTFKAK